MVLPFALLLGILADQIVRVQGRPGIGVALWALAGTVILWWLSRGREAPVSTESRWLVVGALGFAWLLVLRDTEALAVFALLGAVVMLGLAGGRGALSWAAPAHITDVVAAAMRTALLILMGPLGWSVGDARSPASSASSEERRWPRYARAIGRGIVMGLPPLLLLTALLASADPVFEFILRATFLDGIEPLLGHLLFIGFIAWFASGYLRAFLVADEAVMQRASLPRPSLAPTEVAIALNLLNILFLAFLAVQIRYLFGGAGLIEVTEGLTYAEYARRGFFEMVVATVLVVPLLLGADWAAAEDTHRSRLALRATSTLLVLLLAGVLASAAYRMRLYQEAYGLTEDRLYGSVFLVWLAGVLGWLAFTVLRGRRRGFAFGAIAGGLVCIALLHLLNPHALIARVNIARAVSGAEYDGRYLETLSADAVPTLVSRAHELPLEERCRVASILEERWSGVRRGGGKSWNLADARARALVASFPAPEECTVLVAPTSEEAGTAAPSDASSIPVTEGEPESR